MKRPLITMSAITGKPTKSDINQYLFSLKENGIDQAMLYPRSGCELEYLSDEWFDTIGHFLETAKGLDMSIWLYDDFNWPSGDAGGKVTKIPEYRLTSIITKGESIGKISNFSSHNSDLFGQKMFPNLLCADAVDYFIKCTHEEYYKRFSEYFGTVIKGMFTDEASIGYCCTNSSIPYYSGIENDYYELCSRDFTTDLTQGYELFYYYATEAVSNRFRLCYTSRIETWCASHGICMTGHAMNDFNPFYATKYNGRILKNLSCFDIPGIDEIATDFYDRSIFTLFGTAEYTASKQGHAMAELFALGPCDMSYAKKRLMLYYSACHKIDHYFLAISHLDMRGNLLICDYFSNFSADQCDFEGMRLLSSESEKCALLAKKDFCADVYVKYPYDICAKQVTEGFDSTVYNELLYQLTRHQIQWKFIDDEVVNAPVIELISQNELMLDGKIMSVNEICNILCKKPLVTDESSDIIDGIFVRKFDDGEIAVLNTSENEISCKILGNNVIIAPYGVYISSESQLAYSRKEEINCEFKINHKSAQISRLMFLNDSTEVKLTCNEAKNIKFAIRNGTEAYLDGNKIECNSNAFSLPRGMQALYKESKEISLGKGVHSVCSANDLKYMPSVIIIGDFDIKYDGCDAIISTHNELCSAPCAISYYGEIEMTTEIFIPDGAKYIRLDGAKQYTKAYVNNELISAFICPPHDIDVRKYQGKQIKLKIAQYSTLAPIFGNTELWDKESEKSQWRGTPSSGLVLGGFDKISFLY